MRLLGCALVLAWLPAAAHAQLHSYRLTSSDDNQLIINPTNGAFAPGEHNQVYVLLKSGAIRTVNLDNGVITPTPFLALGSVPGANLISSGGNQGLFGLAFDPNYQTNGHVYVSYSSTGDGSNGNIGFARIDRFTRSATDPNLIDPSTRFTIYEQRMNQVFHYAGAIQFGPDGYLYVGQGDGGLTYDPTNEAQRLDTRLGKILRIDVHGPDALPDDPNNNYAIPDSNPFVNTPGARGEIWARGLRNPWGMVFDRGTGDLWIPDVGQSTREELNFQAASFAGGANYGWVLREGSAETPVNGGPEPPDYVGPVFAYDYIPGSGIVGGNVYRAGDIFEDGINSLDGTYIGGDLFAHFWSFRLEGGVLVEAIDRTEELRNPINGPPVLTVSAFFEDSLGRVYFVDYVN
ncbi:MAG TPA: PQQ-dependent sugar dehydrogenase, partial [Gemmatales bacterium]|nr:PQQ-dependent sugar dehydrogenase [Gemmatales bacterium]